MKRLNKEISHSDRKRAANALRNSLCHKEVQTKGWDRDTVQAKIREVLGLDPDTEVIGSAFGQILSFSGTRKWPKTGNVRYYNSKYLPAEAMVQTKQKRKNTLAKKERRSYRIPEDGQKLEFEDAEVTVHGKGITNAKVKKVILIFSVTLVGLLLVLPPIVELF